MSLNRVTLIGHLGQDPELRHLPTSGQPVARMKAEGFEPAVVVETSPNNFQAWLNHGKVLEAAMSTRAKALVEWFGGDPSSADWRHFGRLAGFTNPKLERQLPSGMRPFARLRSATGRVYSRAVEFLAGITKNDESEVAREEKIRPQWHRGRERAGVKPLKEFHSIRSTLAIFTTLIWRGRNTPPAVV